jgi:hypothetical protein
LHVQVGLTGAELTAATMESLGCVLPVVNGRTGRDSGGCLYPAFVWRWKDVSLALFPQRCVATDLGFRWPDNVLVAARRGRRVTAVVEVDGEAYHDDEEAERQRDAELEVPILHLPARTAGRADVVQTIQVWARGLLLEVS